MFADPKVHKDLHVTHGDDSECWVEFYKHPVFMEMESTAANRPIYKDVDYISMQFPGDKTKKVVRPVREDDMLRFPKHWASFLETGVVAVEGTPLEEWTALTKSQALELKGLKIHTVEQLAGIGDHLLSFFGAREYREQAKQYLDKSTGFKGRIAELETKATALEARNQALDEQLRTFMAERAAEKAAAEAAIVAKLEAEAAEALRLAQEAETRITQPVVAKKRPGRPKKVVAENPAAPI